MLDEVTTHDQHEHAYRYGLAFLLVVATVLVRLALAPALHDHGPFLLFIIPIAAAGWFAGTGPALVAVLLSVVSGAMLFLGPQMSLYVQGLEHWAYVFMFSLEGSAVALIASSLRKSEQGRKQAVRREMAARRNAEEKAAAFEREVEQRASVEQALRRSNDELQRFAFVVSHDLQQPLRTAKTRVNEAASAFRHGEAATLPDSLQQISASIDRITEFIGSILAYSRTIGTTAVAEHACDLGAVVNWTLANLSDTLTRSAAKVEIAHLPCVKADFARLSQLFQNLIENAIHYRSDEPPRIALSAEPGPEFWTFSVADNGRGVPDEFAERIFEPFFRVSHAAKPGTGLGLATCAAIAESLGGRIWVEPHQVAGSIFCFTVPVGLIENSKAATAISA